MRSSDGPARRVLYLVTSDISARFLRGQLGHLVRHGFEVVVGSRLSDPPAEFDDGVDVHDLPLVRAPSPIADLRGLVAVLGLIRRTRPDVVNASTPKAGLIGMVGAWILRVPQRVYVVRGLRFETLTGLVRRTMRLLERLTTSCATDVVYNSRSLLEVAEDEGAVRRGRGVVLAGGSGNGIDVERFDDLPSREHARSSLGLPTGARVIGFVGRLTNDKGIVDLVEAFGVPADDTLVVLVGDFEPSDPVPDETRRIIDASPHFVHLPWSDDTRTCYAAMDVLAFPSYREGLPNVPLEAQLCGVAVVAYAATGTVDAVHHGVGGLTVPIGDVAALRSTIDALVHDDARRERLGRCGAAFVRENFAQPAIWNDLIALYRSGDVRERTPRTSESSC